MHQEQVIEQQIADYFKQSSLQRISHEQVLQTLMADITRQKKRLSQKAIIAGLLEKLETENDTAQLQIYRRALEVLLKAD